ncbi:MAG: histidine kinase, partial [Firmicutes bacterium]|nr:histidine kinase [Bacillota bacterium]
ALGTLYWTLHLLLRQETPQVFYVSDLAWLASYVFLLSLTLTLPDAGERQFRTGLCWLAPVFCLPQFALYVTRGDLLLNVLMCGLTMMLAWCAVRGLVWAKKTESGRLRRFHGTVLAFTALEYAMWTASCFWVSDTLTNPYFWFDFLLTLVLLLFLPAVRKAVEA